MSGLLISPCSRSDLAHYEQAREYYEQSDAEYQRFQVERDACVCMCKPCADHVNLLIQESWNWADAMRREWFAISPACRAALDGDETEAK
jgi:hypothetical protein